MIVQALCWFCLPVLGLCMFLVPYLRLPWLAYNIYALFLQRNHECITLAWWQASMQKMVPLERFAGKYASFFPINLHRTVPLSASKKYVMGYHPHGISAIGPWISLAMNANGTATSLFPQLNFSLLARDSLFWLPLMRELALLTGYRSCSKKSCIAHLTTEGHDGRGSGNAIIIAVGGQREAALAKPGAMELVLAKRKGFVKVAIETGADLVPVIGFGENEIWVSGKGNWLHSGRFSFFLPFNRPINVVVGAPIEVTQQIVPDPDFVDKLHAEYVKQLEALWMEWRERFGASASIPLRLVE